MNQRYPQSMHTPHGGSENCGSPLFSPISCPEGPGNPGPSQYEREYRFSRTLACASPELVSAARWVRLVASAASRRAPSSLRWASPAAEAHAGMRTLSIYLGPRGMRSMGGGCGHGCGAEGDGQVRRTGANCLAAGSGLQLPCARAAAAWLGAKMRSWRAVVVTEVWGVSGGRVRGLRVALSSLLLLLAHASEVGWVRTGGGLRSSVMGAAAARSRLVVMSSMAPRTSPQRNSFSTRKARSARSASEHLPPYL